MFTVIKFTQIYSLCFSDTYILIKIYTLKFWGQSVSSTTYLEMTLYVRNGAANPYWSCEVVIGWALEIHHYLGHPPGAGGQKTIFVFYPLFCIENNRKYRKIVDFCSFRLKWATTELKTQITTFEAMGHSSLIIMTTFHIPPPPQGGTVRGKRGAVGA